MDLDLLVAQEETELIVGFFDLRGYAKWCVGRPPRNIFDFIAEIFNCADKHISRSDGYLVKPIGDAGLFLFRADKPDQVINSILEMKQEIDQWLSAQDYPETLSVKMHVGPVACGYLTIEDSERFDLYGETVNRTAMMKGWPLAISTELHQVLSDGVGATFEPFNENELTLIHA